MPKGTLASVGDVVTSPLAPGIEQLWWIDPDRSQKLAGAMRSSSAKLDIPPVEDHYWQDYAKAHPAN